MSAYLWSNNTSRSWWASFALETLGGKNHSNYHLRNQSINQSMKQINQSIN